MSTSRIRAAVIIAGSLSAPVFGQCAQDLVVAEAPSGGDEFGASVASDGIWLAVGAPEGGDGAPSTGAVHMFRLAGGVWTPTQVVTASDGNQFDDFGRSVAISGDWMLVGAPSADVAVENEGAAYLFKRDGTQWFEQQRITQNTPESGDRFGWAVDIDGDVAIIGAFGIDLMANSDGAAVIFRRNGDSWMFEDVIFASDGVNFSQFGHAVAIEGDTALVGAWQDDDEGFFTGATYAFENDGGDWVESQKLLASDAAQFQHFGVSVDIDGAVAVIGAYGDEELGVEAGAAYVFAYEDGAWVERSKLLPADGEANDRFGWSVAIDGASAWVGAYQDVVGGLGTGSVYLYRFGAGGWIENTKIATDEGGDGAQFGASLDARGGRLAIGSPLWDVDGAEDAGAAIAVSDCFCPGDFNGDGILNVLDFVAFQLAWVAQNPGADCDDNDAFNVLDFVCYSQLFTAGCP